MVSFSHQARQHGDLFLPISRSNEGLSDDLIYLGSAIEQIDELLQYCSLTSDSSILDFECGQGRFANGLLAHAITIKNYCGIDTDLESIKWCECWIQRWHPNFAFIHVPAFNARYNPTAAPQQPLPVEVHSFNIAFINSVFSHMLTSDVEFYLTQLHNALRDNGTIYMTAFIEPDVPEVEENPENYLSKTSTGPLHRVRYEQSFFCRLVEHAGFTIMAFKHRGIERTQQSVIIAKRLA